LPFLPSDPKSKKPTVKKIQQVVEEETPALIELDDNDDEATMRRIAFSWNF